MNSPLKILIKYPTRSRPDQFVKTLHLYHSMLADKVNTRILVTVDANDRTMWDFWKREGKDPLVYPDTREPIDFGTPHFGTGKIKAINHDMNKSGEWDIALLASDDMIPQMAGYDDLIREAFNDNLDRFLWIADGRQDRIPTIACMGRTYFDRFGYLYHPSYQSLWCDNEQGDVAERDEVVIKAPCWIRNESPDWGGSQKNDALYRKNNGWYKVDRRNYERRKAQGFPL